MSTSEDPTKGHISYPVLDPARREIRLLRIVEGHEDEIECELRTFSLDDPETKWAALSYCWYDDEAIHPVQVNGATLLLQANLHTFLEELVLKNPAIPDVEWIFIDAICIDQSNVHERAAQVLLMRDVYANASLVIAWLGFIEGFVRVREDLVVAVAVGDTYWTRLWIVQEILLAHRLVIVLGHQSFTWQDIVEFYDSSLWSKYGSRSIENDLGALGVSSVSVLQQSTLADSPEFFTGLAFEDFRSTDGVEPQTAALRIAQCIKLTCADPDRHRQLDFCDAINLFSTQRSRVTHDRIYGLLGIAACHFVPEYDLPLLQLYIQTLANYLLSLGYGKASDHSLYMSTLQQTLQRTANHPLFHILDIDPHDPATAIVTRAVISYFLPQDDRDLYGTLHVVWLVRQGDRWNGDHREIFKHKRRWYMPWRELLTSAWKESCKNGTRFAAERWEEIDGMRARGVAVRSPHGGNEARTVEEWETLALGYCEEVWEAYLKGEGPKTLPRPAAGRLRRLVRSLSTALRGR